MCPPRPSWLRTVWCMFVHARRAVTVRVRGFTAPLRHGRPTRAGALPFLFKTPARSVGWSAPFDGCLFFTSTLSLCCDRPLSSRSGSEARSSPAFRGPPGVRVGRISWRRRRGLRPDDSDAPLGGLAAAPGVLSLLLVGWWWWLQWRRSCCLEVVERREAQAARRRRRRRWRKRSEPEDGEAGPPPPARVLSPLAHVGCGGVPHHVLVSARAGPGLSNAHRQARA